MCPKGIIKSNMLQKYIEEDSGKLRAGRGLSNDISWLGKAIISYSVSLISVFSELIPIPFASSTQGSIS